MADRGYPALVCVQIGARLFPLEIHDIAPFCDLVARLSEPDVDRRLAWIDAVQAAWRRLQAPDVPR